MNNCAFPGRVGRDAETRNTNSGLMVTTFTLANDTGYGARKATQWVRCNWWGERGAKVAEYIRKGKAVTVFGEVSLRTYEKDGKEVVSLELNVTDLVLQSTAQEERREEPAPARERPKPAAKPVADDLDDDCIPF